MNHLCCGASSYKLKSLSSMDQDELRFDIAVLLEQRQRAIDLAQGSLRRELELFRYWLDDLKNETKRQRWLKQKAISEQATNMFNQASKRYLEACVKILSEPQKGRNRTA